MTDESQTSSGPGRRRRKTRLILSCSVLLVGWFMTFIVSYISLDSPPRGPADDEAANCSTAPDSSTVCASSSYVPHPALEDIAENYPAHTPGTSSSSCTPPPGAVSSTSSLHSSTAAPPFPAQTPLPRSKPSSPSSSCTSLSPTPSPTTTPTQTSLGQRRKGLIRKGRRNQRQRGRQGCGTAAREGDRRSEEEEQEEAGGEEKMEEDIEQDVEKMEEETTEETSALQQ